MSSTLREYALGSSQHERARLIRQAEFLKPMTQRVFEEAGIGVGMSVLDLGSGTGDVCTLLAEMVGPTGKVVGLEQDYDTVRFARQRTAAAGLLNITFLPCRFADYVPKEPFDAVVGRSVLLYQSDPAASLASVVKHLHPGGIVAFLEPWLALPQGPTNPALRVLTCIIETMRRSGAHIDLGPRLHKVFTSAGLPQPSMRFEAVMDARSDSGLYQLVAESFVSLLPKAVEYGLTTPDEIDAAAIPAQLSAMMDAVGYAAMSLPTVSAWCRTPEA